MTGFLELFALVAFAAIGAGLLLAAVARWAVATDTAVKEAARRGRSTSALPSRRPTLSTSDDR